MMRFYLSPGNLLGIFSLLLMDWLMALRNDLPRDLRIQQDKRQGNVHLSEEQTD